MAAPTYFGSANNPADNGSLGSGTITITPPGSMQLGDLVAVICQSRASGTWSVGVDGGQSWQDGGAYDAGGTGKFCRIFWCRYDGTWDADPRFDCTSITCTTVVIHVFRPDATSKLWAVDVALDDDDFAAPSTPFTVTRLGLTTVHADAVVLACWHTSDDDSWGTLTGTGWAVTGLAQYRNLQSTDQSSSYAHYLASSAGTIVPNVSKDQTALGGDDGTVAIIAWYAFSSGISQAIGLPTEADTSFAVTRLKSKAIGLVTAASSALPFSRLKVKSIGLATGAGTALPMGRLKTRAIGLATEADSTFPVVWAKSRTAGLASEADSSFPIGRAKIRHVGLPTEADTSLGIGNGKVLALGLATETDQTFSIGISSGLTVPVVSGSTIVDAPELQERAVVTGTVVDVVATIFVSIGQASETDTATPIARRKSRAIGLALEADSAQRVTALGKIGLAQETDTAFPVSVRRSRSIGVAPETDAATPMLHRRALGIGLTVEADTSTGIGRRKTAAFGQASEASAANAVTRLKRRSFGIAEETGTAHPLVHSGGRTIGIALESDAASNVVPLRSRPIGQASESCSAPAIGWKRTVHVGPAQDVELARSVVPLQTGEPTEGSIVVDEDGLIGVFRPKDVLGYPLIPAFADAATITVASLTPQIVVGHPPIIDLLTVVVDVGGDLSILLMTGDPLLLMDGDVLNTMESLPDTTVDTQGVLWLVLGMPPVVLFADPVVVPVQGLTPAEILGTAMIVGMVGIRPPVGTPISEITLDAPIRLEIVLEAWIGEEGRDVDPTTPPVEPDDDGLDGVRLMTGESLLLMDGDQLELMEAA